MSQQLWEILVPEAFNCGREVSLAHHRLWDEKVRSIAGGLTILKTAKGVWVSPSGDIYREAMIPVRIACTEDQIREIAIFTAVHYDQIRVMTYLISERVIRVDKPM